MSREVTFLTLAAILVLGLAWFSFAYQRCPSGASCLLEDAKEWQGLIAGFLALAAALIGGLFVVSATNRQIRALADQFHETIRPYVVARLITRHGAVFTLEITNIGRSMAEDLRLSLDKDFYQFGERRNIREAPAFNRTIPNFAPGETLQFDLSQGFNMDDEQRTPHDFSVDAVYRFERKHYHETFRIDVGHYFSSLARRSTSDHLEDISKALKTIAKQ